MKNVNKRISRKTSGKKSSINIKSESTDFSNVESLVVLNDPKERKKLDGIDERIKFLKSELKSLLGDIRTDKGSESFADKSNLDNMLHFNAKRSKGLETDIKPAETWTNLNESQTSVSREFKPNSNSTPSKFSEWLDKIDSKSQNKKFSTHTIPSNSKVQIDLPKETPVLDPSLTLFTSSSVCLLSQEHVEQMLYKSFLMQNSDVYASESETSGAEINRSTSKTRQQKYKKSRNPQRKFSMGKPNKNNFTPYRGHLRRGEKRRIIDLSPLHSDIEVITLDSSSGSKIADKSASCVDLDVSNYDWSEPFEINKETQFHSEVQATEHGEVNYNCMNYKEWKSDSLEVTESNRIVCHDDSGKIQPNTVWECPVCLERSKGQEIVATQCGHVFCRKCLEEHILKLSNSCPSCRCDLRDKPFITLFNF